MKKDKSFDDIHINIRIIKEATGMDLIVEIRGSNKSFIHLCLQAEKANIKANDIPDKKPDNTLIAVFDMDIYVLISDKSLIIALNTVKGETKISSLFIYRLNISHKIIQNSM